MCQTGRFSNITRAPWPTECETCAPGKVALEYGSLACKQCPAGQFSSPEFDGCAQCNPGTFVNNSACVYCPPGRFAPDAVSGSCILCEAGFSTQGVALAATSCSACAPGTYSEGKAVDCSECVPGRFSGSRASECPKCPAGNTRDSFFFFF